MADLDIVIPVYNEGVNILRVLAALKADVTTAFRVLVCYDFDEDTTLAALRSDGVPEAEIALVLNPNRGPHSAVVAGLRASTAPAVVVYAADDDYNAGILDSMAEKIAQGNDIACASRFMPGGSMVGCPWLKAVLVRGAGFTMRHFARMPTHDASNGFRMFSRRTIEEIQIESTEGFTYSLELLVKVHRMGWKVAEVPAQWIERNLDQGASRFKVLGWLPAYLRWYFYGFATTILKRSPRSVPRIAPQETAPTND
jgi:glycosyltransferase involved in cell wall biosynthesis